MNDLFKDIQLPKPKKHFVEIQGQKIEVSLEKKLEIQQRGIDKYIFEDGQFIIKPVPKKKRSYAELTKSDSGYRFLNQDPYWPTEITEGGYTWQIPSE